MSSRSSSQSASIPRAGTAIVTGGARRLGAAIALALARRGWDVAVHYGSSAGEALQVVEKIRALGREAVALDCDLTDEAAACRLVARAAEALGSPACLVNSASRFEADDAASFDYASLAAHMRVNLAAPVLLARELHRQLPDDARGVVVNLLDQKLFNPNPDFLCYTLSKAGLQAATTLLAQALAPRLRVVGVAPGITLPAAGQSEASFAKARTMTPLGHSSSVDDIANAVCFAVESPAITGTTLLVDGGQHLVPSERDILFLAR